MRSADRNTYGVGTKAFCISIQFEFHATLIPYSHFSAPIVAFLQVPSKNQSIKVQTSPFVTAHFTAWPRPPSRPRGVFPPASVLGRPPGGSERWRLVSG